LVSLAYLWECEQDRVLDAMLHSNLHAILIKVASMGLSARQLGKPLSELSSNFAALVCAIVCVAIAMLPYPDTTVTLTVRAWHWL
jgi:diphthamide synthase (EF-2-diphthine--ammonia ligase)